MTISVGCHLITWRDRAIADALDDIAAAGYAGVEGNSEMAEHWNGKEDALARLLVARRLQFIAADLTEDWTDAAGTDSYAARAEEAAQFLSLLGVSVLVLRPGPRLHSERTTDEELSHMGLTMGVAAVRTARYGVQAAVHPHWNTALQNRDELDLLMDHTASTPLMLCIDTAHLARAGMDPSAVATQYEERLVHVHLKDMQGAEFVALGHGTVNLPAFVRTLKDINYDRWVSVELGRTEQEPKESATMIRLYVEQVLGLPARPAA